MVRSTRNWWSAVSAITVVGCGVQIAALPQTLSGDLHDFRQAQTALVIREFARFGFDWRTPLPVFGADSFVPMEFPLFQLLASMVSSSSGLAADTSGRLTSLVFFQASALLVALLGRRWFSPRAGIIALLLVQLLPFGIYWGRASLIEFLPVALMLAATFVLDEMDRRRPLLIVVSLSSAVVGLVLLGFLAKSTTAGVLTVVLLVPILRAPATQRVLRTVVAIVAVLVGVAGAVAWNRAADTIKRESKFTEFLTSGNLRGWNFGTLDQRLSAETWYTIFQNHQAAISGGVAFVIVATAVSLVTWNWNPASWILAGSVLIGPVVFTNLYVVHNYYSVAVYAQLCLLMASAIAGASKLLDDARGQAALAVLMTLMIVLLAWLSPAGRMYSGNLLRTEQPVLLVEELRRLTEPSATVLLLSCDWSPLVPFAADRDALMITEWHKSSPTESDLMDVTHAAFCVEPEGGYEAYLNQVLPSSYVFEPVADGVYSVTRPTS